MFLRTSCNSVFVTNEDLIDYFKNTWIGKPRRSGTVRMNPKFSLNIWNCYKATLNDLLKTNNSVEGCCRNFSSLLGAHQPSIWIFIERLQLQQTLNEFKIAQYTAGMVPLQEKRNYRDTTLRIKSVVENYEGPTLRISYVTSPTIFNFRLCEIWR